MAVVAPGFVRHAPRFRGFEFMRQVRQGDYPSGIFRKTGVPRMLERNPPTYYQRNLEHLVVLAKHQGVQPVLQPSLDQARYVVPENLWSRVFVVQRRLTGQAAQEAAFGVVPEPLLQSGSVNLGILLHDFKEALQ